MISSIALSQSACAIVDSDMREELGKYKWYLAKDKCTSYAIRSVTVRGKRTVISMHRQIMGNPRGKEVDHINGNGLDNRESNLRVCSRSQNARNRSHNRNSFSQLRGVGWHKKSMKWQAYIKVDGKSIHLGLFETKNEAAKAFNVACKKHFKEFSRLNPVKK